MDQAPGASPRGGGDVALTDIDPLANSGPRKNVTSNFTREGYEAAVQKVREYINAGDAFQIVLSQRFRTETTAKPFDIYRALRVVNPSPFMFYLRAGEVTLVAGSDGDRFDPGRADALNGGRHRRDDDDTRSTRYQSVSCLTPCGHGRDVG